MRRSPAISVVAAFTLSLSAVAQNRPLLDLTAAPTAPGAGTGSGTLALADSLAADATSMSKVGSADARVRAELRRLARELLVSGEKAGQAGSARVVMGRTLANSLLELDRLTAAAADDPLLHAAAADLAAACKLLETGNPDPDVVLRDALAVLSKLAGPASGVGGWIDDRPDSAPSPLAAKLDNWAKLPGITPEAIESLRQVGALAQTTESWPAYNAASLRTRAMLLDAATAFEGPPTWMPEPALRILGDQFSTAVKKLATPDSRTAAFDDLSRLAAVADLIRRVNEIEDNPAGKRIRASVAQAVSIPVSQADARTMESFSQLIALIASRAVWQDEKALIRQLRPGYRIFTAAARQSEQHVLAGLPEVLRRPEAMTDPGILASISAHRRAVADVEGLIAANTAFAARGEGEPVADKAWQNAANRALKLTQDLGRADQKEAALTSLRSLFAHIDRCWKLPGEEQLRQAVKDDAGKPAKERTSAWAKLSGGREAALAGEITDRRAGWLFDWEKSIAQGSDGQRLEALSALMELMHDAGPVIALQDGAADAYASLQAWPGWELTPASVAAVSAGLADQSAEATRLLLAGESANAAEAVTKTRKDCAVALLAGRLAREAQRRGVSPDRTAPAALRELTAGGPIRARSWLGRDTELLDDVCRYAEEVAALRRLGAKDKADAVQRFANLRAAEVMERLGGKRAG